jgi:colanic acid biosynthesis glycosyl transferase WcaI
MRILIITQWFEPEPAFKGLAFASALRDRGHEVRVMTGYPNYPGGVVYPGYRIRGIMHEMMDNIRITRLPLYPSHSKSRIGRIFNYGSFALTAVLYGLLIRFKPDVIYVYHPPLTIDISACIISKLRGVPLLVDVHDLWPDTLVSTGMVTRRSTLAFIGAAARHVYRRAAVITTCTPGFRARLLERDLAPDKVRLVYNWCNEAKLRQRSSTPPAILEQLRGKFTVVYAGNMGPAQNLSCVLDAAAKLRTVRPDIAFVCVGSGIDVATLKQKARQLELHNVHFLPQMPMEEVGHVLDAADAVLVHLRDDPLFAISIPSKIQAYLFAGKPIIVGVKGNAAALVEEAQAGIAVAPDDAAAMADSIATLATMPVAQRVAMGERGRAYYDAHLSFHVGVDKMEAALEAAASLRQDTLACTRYDTKCE